MSWLVFLPNLNMGGGGTVTPTGPATIREAVFTRLSGIDALTAKVGSRIYPCALPQAVKGTPAFPAVSFYVVGREFNRNLSGPSGLSTTTFRISCWSRTESEAAEMAESIRLSMDGFRGLWGQVVVLGCFLQDETDLPEYPRDGGSRYTYQTVLTFDISHRISIPVSAA